MAEYKLSFLKDKQFDALALKDPRYDTKDALGFADMRTGEIYVRDTGIPLMNQFVANHEIEEILSKYSEHEVDGIRYKKGGFARFILPAVLGLVPGIGPLLSTLSGAGMGAYASSKHPQQLGSPLQGGLMGALSGFGGGGLASGAAGGIKGLMSGGLSGLGKGISSGLGSYTASIPGFGPGGMFAGGAGTAGSAAGGGAGSTGVGAAQKMISQSIMPGTGLNAAVSGASSPWTSGLGSALGGFAGSTMGSMNSGLNTSALPTGSQVSQGALSSGQNLTGMPSNLFSPTNTQPFNNSITGANFGGGGGLPASGVSGVGSAQNLGFGGAVGGGGLPSTGVQAAGVGQGMGATQQTGLQKLLGSAFPGGNNYSWGKTALGASIPLLGGAFAPKPQPLNPMDSAQYADLLKRVQSGTMVNLTPAQQQAIEGNYDRELAIAQENLSRQWRAARPGSDMTNDTEFQYMNSQLQQQYATQKAAALTQAQMGLTQDQTQNLMQLAQLDVYSLAQTAGITAQEAQQFKDMMSGMGTMVATGGGNSQASGLMKMFGQ